MGLNEALSMFKGADGKDYPVSGKHIVSTQVRQAITATVKELDPEAYAVYRQIKYANGENPDIETRKKAYRHAFEAFLRLTYHIPGF